MGKRLGTGEGGGVGGLGFEQLVPQPDEGALRVEHVNQRELPCS